jgi:hypothetical protein
MADTTYRSWLQGQANTGNSVADALLQVVGDDGRVNDTFASTGSFLGYGDPNHGGYKFSKDEVLNNNQEYWDAFTGGPAREQNTNNTISGGSSYRQPSYRQPSYSQDDINLIDHLIGRYQDSINRIGSQRTIGEENINNSYNAGITSLGNQRTAAKGAHDTQVAETGQDYVNTRSKIGREAGNQTNAMRRLLGSIGAGRSTAARELTPYAAGLQASSRFGDVQQDFARNQSKLDTTWNSTRQGFDDEEAYLGTEKTNKLNQLNSGLAQTEADLQGSIADQVFRKQQVMGGNAAQAIKDASPYQSRISELLNQIDNYGRLSVAQPKEIQYQRPDLEKYNYSRFDAPTLSGDQRGSYISPYARLLKRDEEKKLSY